MDQRAVGYARRAPHPRLAPFVDSLWMQVRGPLAHARERNLPTGCADLIVALGDEPLRRYADDRDAAGLALRGGVLQGACDRATLRDTSRASSVVGVHWRPGALPALIGDRADMLAGRTVSIEDAWGRPATEALREHLAEARTAAARFDRLEAWLWQRLRNAPAPDPMVAQALRRLAADPPGTSIGSLQRDSGCAPATFIARFRHGVGLTPKRYARVLRLGRVLQQAARTSTPPDWAALAAAAGYTDQSHLSNDFRALTGLSPGRYRAVTSDAPMHVVAALRTDG